MCRVAWGSTVKRKRVPGALTSDAVAKNSIDTLYANIRFQDVDHNIKSIVVTSSVPNEGKSTISAELARTMAASGKRTALVECDLHRRSLANILGVHSQQGLLSILTAGTRLSESLAPTKTQNLWFLDSEPGVPEPSDILGSESFARVLRALERSFDYVIVDTPPLAAFPDAALVASRVDASILVVREGFVKRKELQQAKEQLDRSGVRQLGIVMNFCEDGSPDRYYRDHYQGASAR